MNIVNFEDLTTFNPLYVAIDDKINNTITVITNATKVITFSFNIFIFNSPFLKVSNFRKKTNLIICKYYWFLAKSCT